MGLRLFSFSTLIFLLSFIAIGEAAQAPKPSYDEKAVANFYRGKSIRIIVGFTAGGGYDQYSRLIGRHISKFIPGNPNVIVDNMTGAGSIIAMPRRRTAR
jgi:tripartite-type tricarboxylate transporter receptor subunit TctC